MNAHPLPTRLLARFARLFAILLTALLCQVPLPGFGQAYQWTNFAGLPGGPGKVDGPVPLARFKFPTGTAVDANGNVYVADQTNFIVRKITPGGVVSTVAGDGTNGTADGPANVAQFRSPYALAVTGSGIIYVADRDNHTLRKITPAGMVTTFAGVAGVSGSADGVGNAARFNKPTGIGVDASGNVYVADSENYTVRKISPIAEVSTLAGNPGTPGFQNGTGNAARFGGPTGLAVDSNGNIYVTELNHNIRKITPLGDVTRLAGTSGGIGSVDGTGSAAKFDSPTGIAVDGSGTVFVVDRVNRTIRKVTSDGVVTTLAGSVGMTGYADGTGSAARFDSAYGLAVDGSGNLYLADSYNFAIRKITTTTGVVTTYAGSADSHGSANGTGTAARFNGPFGVGADGNGNVYVADFNNHTLRKITPAGVATTLAGFPGSPSSANGVGASARFNGPAGVAVDGNGNIYVSDYFNHLIRKCTPGGSVTTLAGGVASAGSANGTGSAARFNNPIGLAVDGNGNVYVADQGNCTIRKITSGGAVTTLAGSPGIFGSADGTGSAAQFSGPSGVAVDGSGNVFVADYGNTTIRRITPGGVVTTLAGSAGNYGSTDGPGSVARFSGPGGVAVDGIGHLFVTDGGNGTIRRVTSSGVVTTIGGTPGLFSYAEGLGGNAVFWGVAGIAVTNTGTLYLTDSTNHNVSRGIDATTEAPILIAPAANTLTGSPVSVSFELPEAAQAGSVKLSFGATELVLAASQQSSGAHAFSFASSNPTASPQIASGSAIADGTYTVTLSYQDAFGNAPASAVSTNVTIDTTPAVITLNGANPQTIEAITAYVELGATANDAIAGNLTGAIQITGTVNTSVPGSYTRTYTVTDPAGNIATAQRTVKVVDTTLPTITILGANPATTEAGLPYNDAGATASDTVAGNLTAAIQVTSNLNVNVPGNYTVTYTVSDGFNTATASRAVNVVDTTAPIITHVPNPRTATGDANNRAPVPDFRGELTATDNVGVVSVTQIPAPGTSVGFGTHTITLTVEDAAHHSVSCTTTFTVNDGPALPGRYAGLLADAQGAAHAFMELKLTSGQFLTGYLRLENGTRAKLPGTVIPPTHTTTLTLSNGSVLTLVFDGFGHVTAMLGSGPGALTANGVLANPSAPPGTPGKYTAILEPEAGGAPGWLYAVVSSRGAMRLSGVLPDGSPVSAHQGSIVDRHGDAFVFLLGSKGARKLLAGQVHFADLPASDFSGELAFDGAPCAVNGAEFIPAPSGLPPGAYPLALTGAGVDIASTVTLLPNNSATVLAPVASFTPRSKPGQPSTGLFYLSFRKPPATRGALLKGTGVFHQKLGIGVGQFGPIGATGHVELGAAGP